VRFCHYATLTGAAPTISPNWGIVDGGLKPEDYCTTGFLMIRGAQCTLNVSFEPTQSGPLAGAVTIKDNALNALAQSSRSAKGNRDRTIGSENYLVARNSESRERSNPHSPSTRRRSRKTATPC
jgi:hypothetical protein